MHQVPVKIRAVSSLPLKNLAHSENENRRQFLPTGYSFAPSAEDEADLVSGAWQMTSSRMTSFDWRHQRNEARQSRMHRTPFEKPIRRILNVQRSVPISFYGAPVDNLERSSGELLRDREDADDTLAENLFATFLRQPSSSVATETKSASNLSNDDHHRARSTSLDMDGSPLISASTFSDVACSSASAASTSEVAAFSSESSVAEPLLEMGFSIKHVKKAIDAAGTNCRIDSIW